MNQGVTLFGAPSSAGPVLLSQVSSFRTGTTVILSEWAAPTDFGDGLLEGNPYRIDLHSLSYTVQVPELGLSLTIPDGDTTAENFELLWDGAAFTISVDGTQ